MTRLCRVGSVDIGAGKPLAIIAGPCVLESLDHALSIGRAVKSMCAKLGLSYIFKASFDKANRSSINSARGPGLERGLEWLASIRRELSVPITTDIHDPSQAEPAARVVDLLQIPAFLSRQTDLLQAAGHAAVQHKRGVNVKKGQFMAPSEMNGAVRKLAETGCENVMLTERGTFFGYHRLVNDFLGVADLIEGVGESGKKLFGNAPPPPVCFDCTHSTQLPGSGETTGGRPERAPALARAATAIGVHALFIECHPDPAHALSDGATVQPMDCMESLLTSVAKIRGAM
jgi:2-dehydro-3-deoxyphosphooctonate aldolase (KDO 8-P synthase)